MTSLKAQQTHFSVDGTISISKRLLISQDHLLEVLKDIKSSYHRFPIAKGNGRKRWIEAPNRKLKHLQKKLLELLYKNQPHTTAHGFVPGRSIVTNAQPHVGKKWVINYDITDFFPSTKESMVATVLTKNEQLTGAELKILLRLTCLNGCLPQGAPTSPHLANLAFWDADVALCDYAQKHALTYTRYADDLTFSGNTYPEGITNFVSKTLKLLGYDLAYHKTKFLGQHKRQMVTGLVVNEKVNLARPLRKKIRAILHDSSKVGFRTAIERSTWTTDQLLGRIALQMMWDKETAEKHFKALLDIL